MRKVSKSRADDDVTSSTNGSVFNETEDHAPETEQQQDEEKEVEHSQAEEDDEEEGPENGNNSDNDPSFDENAKEKKKKSGKSKPKKKKSMKAKKQEEYEVEKVVDSKKIKGKLHYLIRWKGYSADSDTWEPANTVSCPDLIEKYNDEKENSKKRDSTDVKSETSKKRKGRPSKQSKSPAKRPRNEEWDSENADENAEYEVDRILEVHHKKNGKREFLIHWKGWSTKFDSWEPESNLNCPDLIKKFMDKVNAARSKDTRSLRVAPETTSRFTLQAPTTGRRLSKRGGQRQRVRYDDAE